MSEEAGQGITLDEILVRKALAEDGGIFMLEEYGIQAPMLTEPAQKAIRFIQQYQVDNGGVLPGDGLLVYEMGWNPIPINDEKMAMTCRHVAKLIHERAVRNHLNKSIMAVQNEMMRGRDYILSARDMYLDSAGQLRDIGEIRKPVVNLNDLLPDVLAAYARYKRKEIGIPFPWGTVTNATSGLQMGQLMYILARPQTGKTWALLLILLQLRALGLRVLLVSPELHGADAAERAACMIAKVSYDAFTRGDLGVFAEEKLEEVIAEIKDDEGLLLLEDTMSFTSESVEHAIDRFDPDVIGVDSIYMFGAKGRDRGDKISRASPWLKELTTRHRKRIVLGTSQMNRQANCEEKMTDEYVFGSDAIQQDGDIVYSMFQDNSMYKDRIMGFFQMKVRRGRRHAPFYTRWDIDAMAFAEIEPEDEQTIEKSDKETEDSWKQLNL